MGKGEFILQWALPVGIGVGLAALVEELFSSRPIVERIITVVLSVLLGLVAGLVLGYVKWYQDPASKDRKD